MIPITSTDVVKYKDEDGITYKFRPKTAKLEYEAMSTFGDGFDKLSAIEQINARNAFIKKILIGWEGAPMPEDGDILSSFTSKQMWQISGLWHKANEADVEEKKS